jgi:hypothetical protein
MNCSQSEGAIKELITTPKAKKQEMWSDKGLLREKQLDRDYLTRL